jgi:hypothetical protein
MRSKQLLITALILALASGSPILAQDEEISPEDEKVIEVLDILENLEVLEEDPDLIEFLTEVGDDYED